MIWPLFRFRGRNLSNFWLVFLENLKKSERHWPLGSRWSIMGNILHLVNIVKERPIKELTCSVWVGDEAVLGRFFLRSTPAWPPTPPTPPPPPPLPPTPTPSTRWWCAWSSQPQFLCKLSCLWASAATASSFSDKVRKCVTYIWPLFDIIELLRICTILHIVSFFFLFF